MCYEVNAKPQLSKALNDAVNIAQWLRQSASERDQARHLSTEQVDAYATSGLWAVIAGEQDAHVPLSTDFHFTPDNAIKP